VRPHCPAIPFASLELVGLPCLKLLEKQVVTFSISAGPGYHQKSSKKQARYHRYTCNHNVAKKKMLPRRPRVNASRHWKNGCLGYWHPH